jgi:hypothetical protein
MKERAGFLPVTFFSRDLSNAGMAVELARAGWNLAILIQTKFEKAGVGEAPRP